MARSVSKYFHHEGASSLNERKKIKENHIDNMFYDSVDQLVLSLAKIDWRKN
jgi:hypothetical protein